MTDHFLTLLRDAIPFVKERRKTSGGFSATPTLPATIEDTYHSMRILDIAKQYGVTERETCEPGMAGTLQSYLESCHQRVPAGPRTTFQLFWCSKTSGLKFAPDDIEENVLQRMQESFSPEEWYYLARIQQEVIEDRKLKIANQRNLDAALQRDWRSVDEAWMHMYLSMNYYSLASEIESELISWFRACQNGDGGFGFYPGTTSFIENCYYSLRALAALRAKPADPVKARRFLESSQTASGGFGRSLRAAPFLDSTWYGLAALAVLG